MPYTKLYNPDDREFLLILKGVEVKIPPRQAVIIDGNLAAQVHEIAPALEKSEASDEQYKEFVAGQAKPKKKKGKK